MMVGQTILYTGSLGMNMMDSLSFCMMMMGNQSYPWMGSNEDRVDDELWAGDRLMDDSLVRYRTLNTRKKTGHQMMIQRPWMTRKLTVFYPTDLLTADHLLECNNLPLSSVDRPQLTLQLPL